MYQRLARPKIRNRLPQYLLLLLKVLVTHNTLKRRPLLPPRHLTAIVDGHVVDFLQVRVQFVHPFVRGDFVDDAGEAHFFVLYVLHFFHGANSYILILFMCTIL